MSLEEEIKELCPKCGGRAWTKVHPCKVLGMSIVDVGWFCEKCGYEWGFEFDHGS